MELLLMVSARTLAAAVPNASGGAGSGGFYFFSEWGQWDMVEITLIVAMLQELIANNKSKFYKNLKSTIDGFNAEPSFFT